MAPLPLVLEAVIASGLFWLPSTAFVPGVVSSVFLQDQRECPSATTAPAIHEQRRHPSPSPRIARRDRQVRHTGKTQLRAAEGGGASNRGEFLRRVAEGTFAAAAAAGCTAAAVGGPEEAGAFCGEPYPYWAYFMDFDEVFVPFKFEGYSGNLFARTVGNGKEQKKVR